MILRARLSQTVRGDSSLVQVSASPRAGTWSDDLRVQTPVGSHVTIFDHSPRGAPRLRVGDGGAVRVSSSIHWRSKGAWSGRTRRGSSDDVAGQVVCRSGEFVPIGPGEEGYIRPVACVEHGAQSQVSSTLSVTHRAEPRAVMVIVSDLAPRLAERAALLRRFARAQGVTSGLTELASEVVPPGRWVFVTHVPRRQVRDGGTPTFGTQPLTPDSDAPGSAIAGADPLRRLAGPISRRHRGFRDPRGP